MIEVLTIGVVLAAAVWLAAFLWLHRIAPPTRTPPLHPVHRDIYGRTWQHIDGYWRLKEKPDA